MIHLLRTGLLSLCLALLYPGPGAAEPELSFKLRVAGLGEGERDLGLRGLPRQNEAYAELTPGLHWPIGLDSRFYARAQAFLPSGAVLEEEHQRTVASNAYFAMRELWFEYGGLTTYPGEVLRVGLQRLRAPDGMWWDQDIEAVRWIFDTTLLQAQFGIAERFSSYRTDRLEVPNSPRDRTYLFASWNVQWRPRHFVGLRGTYAQDRGELPQAGTFVHGDYKRQDRQVGWASLNIGNDFFDYRDPQPFAYWAEVTGYVGSRQLLLTEADGSVAGTATQDVRAMALDAAARFRLPGWPLQAGLAYAYGQGGRTDGASQTFEQTQLHSNRSRFTGTSALINRFNDALRADLSNLHVATGFVSMPGDRHDFSVVFNRFRRDDRFGRIAADGLDVDPVVNSPEIGTGVDVVVTRNFMQRGRAFGWDEDVRSNVRLRASHFQPGAAYGPNASGHYRLALEATLWF